VARIAGSPSIVYAAVVTACNVKSGRNDRAWQKKLPVCERMILCRMHAARYGFSLTHTNTLGNAHKGIQRLHEKTAKAIIPMRSWVGNECNQLTRPSTA
jgi:hypothetical protein